MHLQFKPGIGTCVKPLNAHLLQVTVDRLNRMTIRAQFDVVHILFHRGGAEDAERLMENAALSASLCGEVPWSSMEIEHL